jgi:hypothetical protein
MLQSSLTPNVFTILVIILGEDSKYLNRYSGEITVGIQNHIVSFEVKGFDFFHILQENEWRCHNHNL